MADTQLSDAEIKGRLAALDMQLFALAEELRGMRRTEPGRAEIRARRHALWREKAPLLALLRTRGYDRQRRAEDRHADANPFPEADEPYIPFDRLAIDREVKRGMPGSTETLALAAARTWRPGQWTCDRCAGPLMRSLDGERACWCGRVYYPPPSRRVEDVLRQLEG